MRESFAKEFSTLREESVSRDVPNITLATGKALYAFVRMLKPERILEIGSANGLSTMVLAEALQENGIGEVDTIDWSKPTYEEATGNFISHGYHNIHQHFGDARLLIPDLTEEYDFVFIDAMKKDYLKYLKLIQPKVKARAVVVLDDVVKFKRKMEDLYTFLEESKADYTILHTDADDGIMVLYDIVSLPL